MLYLTLHYTWQKEGRQHTGILALYREHNPQRDLTYAQIARAISRLERVGLPLQNTFPNVNMWREPSHREQLRKSLKNNDATVAWIF